MSKIKNSNLNIENLYSIHINFSPPVFFFYSYCFFVFLLLSQVVSGETVSVTVTVQREIDEEDEDEENDEEKEKKDNNIGKVVCPRYGMEKQEAYWLLIGDLNTNALLSIKRISIGDKPSKVSTYSPTMRMYIAMNIHILEQHLILFVLNYIHIAFQSSPLTTIFPVFTYILMFLFHFFPSKCRPSWSLPLLRILETTT